MKKSVLAICILLFLSIQASAMAVEKVAQVFSSENNAIKQECEEFLHINATIKLPQNISKTEIGVYTVSIFENIYDVLIPSLFSNQKVVHSETISPFQKEFEWDMAPVYYTYENGDRLSIIRNNMISWHGEDAYKYEQLFSCTASWFEDMPEGSLSFMSRSEALDLAQKWIETIGIKSPSLYKIYSVGVSEIEALNAELTRDEHGKAIAILRSLS